MQEEPPVVRQAACSSTCTICSCATTNLYELLNPRELDELTVLRRKLAISEHKLAQTERERDQLQADCERVAKARRTIARTARKRKVRIGALKVKMMKLKEASHKAFERLVQTHTPPQARHLKHLFDAQLRALRSKSLRTYSWLIGLNLARRGCRRRRRCTPGHGVVPPPPLI